MLLCEWVLRPDGHPFDPYAIHHGGELSKAPDRFYDGGKVHWFDQIDSDGFSVVEVTHMVAGLGYVNPKMEYWYKMPDKDALLPLSNDSDVLRFTNELSEVPNVGEPSEVPNVGEPNVGDQNEVPNVADQTEIPNDVEHSDGSEESDDRSNDVPVEDTQPIEAEVFEDLDLEDFDSASDPDDVDNNRKKP
ncbi:hypothetical protein Tco_0820183 [Tanacetum coccineum]|uniref:PB1-like domain-containing protein n=1 Tax=Tanacetum coccineum TaxID=301880 RepID=A0ABQ5AAE7_9ASTR